MFISLSYRQLHSNISEHVLSCNCAKINCFITFCVKFTIYKKIHIFKKGSYKNIFFILRLYYTLTEKLHGNALSKRKVTIFFQLEIFVDEATFNFHSFKKLMIFLLLNVLLKYSIHFI